MAQKGKVYVHGNRWIFRYKVPEWTNGRKVWKDVYKDLAPAEQYASEAQLRRDNLVPTIPDTGNATPQQTQLLYDYVEQVYFPKHSTALKSSTRRSYKQVWNCYVQPNTKGLRMCDLTLPVATELLNKISREKSLSTSSFQKMKWFGAAVFKQAMVDGGYDWKLPNPFSGVPLPKSRKPKKAGRYATLEDVIHMLNACDSIDAGKAKKLGISVEQAKLATGVVALAAFSGLRKSEMQGLRWDHLKDGNIHVQQIAWRPTIIEQTKTTASTDSVPVIKMLSNYLEAHRNGFPREGYIFAGPKLGRPLDLHNLANRVVRPILADADVPWCGWHGFRRGLASTLHALGENDLNIQKVMRHSHVDVTRASYIKVSDAAKTDAMAKLQAVLGRKHKTTSHRRHKPKA